MRGSCLALTLTLGVPAVAQTPADALYDAAMVDDRARRLQNAAVGSETPRSPRSSR